MPAGLYFVLKYFSFTFTTHLAYNDTRLYRHKCFGPYDVIITELNCNIFGCSFHYCGGYFVT
jgi:hypothetical protein